MYLSLSLYIYIYIYNIMLASSAVHISPMTRSRGIFLRAADEARWYHRLGDCTCTQSNVKFAHMPNDAL